MTDVALVSQLRKNANDLSVTMMSTAIAILAEGRVRALLNKPLNGDLLQSSIETAVHGR